MACLWKLCTPLPFHLQLEEMEKPRKDLTPKVRVEPACLLEKQSPVFSLYLPS